MQLSVKIEYKGTDEKANLYVVRIIDNENNFIYKDFLISLERLKNKIWCGKKYKDVWKCDRYILCATKTYSVEDVIKALYGDKILDGDEDWFYV